MPEEIELEEWVWEVKPIEPEIPRRREHWAKNITYKGGLLSVNDYKYRTGEAIISTLVPHDIFATRDEARVEMKDASDCSLGIRGFTYFITCREMI